MSLQVRREAVDANVLSVPLEAKQHPVGVVLDHRCALRPYANCLVNPALGDQFAVEVQSPCISTLFKTDARPTGEGR